MDDLMVFRCLASGQMHRLLHPKTILTMRFIPPKTDPKLAVSG
jgi:hypothetical protein